MPACCYSKAPGDINCYSDGSLLHSRGEAWKIGGVGCWWPKRTHEPNDAERTYLNWAEREEGRMAWSKFTGLKGSSTRSETAALMMCMLADGVVAIGTDSLSMVKKFAGIAKHMCLRGKVQLRAAEASHGCIVAGPRNEDGRARRMVSCGATHRRC